MNILPLNRLVGVATFSINSVADPSRSIVEPTLRTLNAKLAGTYRANLALSQVVLTGNPDSRGTSLQVGFYNGATAPSLLRGKVLGQVVRLAE